MVTVAPPPPPAGHETADGERTLRDRIDFVVGAEQWGLQQHAALEGFGVAHGGHLHVNALAGFDERRNVRRDHDDGDVLGRERRGRHVDAVALEHVGDGLLGVNRVLVAVAGQPDHEAVADKLVVARAGNHGQIAHAHACRRERQTPVRHTTKRARRQ